MRQIIKKWMCSVFVLCATVCLVACDKNDSTSEKITGKVTYKLSEIYDLKDLADITIVYTDATGKNVMETVTGTTWEKTVEVSPGFKAYMKVSHKKKANVTYTKSSYKIANNFSISCSLSNGMSHPNTINMYQTNGAKPLIEIALNKLVENSKELSLKIENPLKEYMK